MQDVGTEIDMRKIITLLCVLLLAFCITACGKKSGKTDSSESSSSPAVSSQSGETAEDENSSSYTSSEQAVKQNKTKPSQGNTVHDEVNLDGNDSAAAESSKTTESGSKSEDSSSGSSSESEYYDEWRR